jgi:hypothetical protein
MSAPRREQIQRIGPMKRRNGFHSKAPIREDVGMPCGDKDFSTGSRQKSTKVEARVGIVKDHKPWSGGPIREPLLEATLCSRDLRRLTHLDRVGSGLEASLNGTSGFGVEPKHRNFATPGMRDVGGDLGLAKTMLVGEDLPDSLQWTYPDPAGPRSMRHVSWGALMKRSIHWTKPLRPTSGHWVFWYKVEYSIFGRAISYQFKLVMSQIGALRNEI